MSFTRNDGRKKRKDKSIKEKKFDKSEIFVKQNDNFQVKLILPKEEKVKINPPELLLSYLYHINMGHSKYVTSGFNSKTFNHSVIIADIGNGFVELNDMEYSSLFLKSEKINNYFNKYDGDFEAADHIVYNPENLIQYMDIEYMLINDAKHIQLQITGNTNESNRVLLNETEWSQFNELFGFFNQLILWHKNITPSVTAYYNHYVKLCADKNQIYLGNNDFFTLNEIMISDDEKNFNYYRLFHEIGLMCIENITIAILQKIYSKNK